MRVALLLWLAAPAAPSARAALPAPVWGYDAHRLICQIAWRELTPRAQQGVADLLGMPSRAEAFAEACIWADEIRADSSYARYRTAHYMNVPVGAAAVDPKVHCADTYCVVEAIADLRRDAADRRLDRARRADALRFLVHFVADLHQPLHVGRAGDRGGNDMPVQFFDEQTNLHVVWDAGLVQRALLDPWDARWMHALITPADRRAWQDLDPVSWANESFVIVERQVYRGVVPNAVLGDTYAERNRFTIETRILQAGVRLGALLNQIFGG